MAGIASVMNIAKEALQAHQSSLQVAGHNVANVDTPGYTRQGLVLKPALATPSSYGDMGNGVIGERIRRYYDAFSTNRIVRQGASLGVLEARQETMRMIETVFNEAPGLALNELMSGFWDSVQTLSNNPELFASRQTVVQQATMVMDQFQMMSAEMVRSQYDIGVSLGSAIREVNSLTRQIADLNVKITTSETEVYKANDLRDQRDALMKELSSMLDINYFETDKGNYTVILKDGYSLVDINESWKLEWSEGTLQWVSKTMTPQGERETRFDVGSGKELGGKIGGWLESYNLLNPNNPDSYAGRLHSLANAFIREVNLRHSKGVGMTSFTGELAGTDIAADTGLLTTSVSAATAMETIAAGTLRINGRSIGKIDGAMATYGLGTVKAYNAVKAINEAVTGVTARLTTQVAGSAVTAVGAAPADNGAVLSFEINGITVSYAIDNDGVGPDDSSAATFAANLAAAVNSAMTAQGMSIEAVVGDGTNGGVLNSIVLRNTNPGDDSRIVIGGIDPATAPLEGNLGLKNGTYTADARNNTGEISLFSIETFTVVAGATDLYLDHFGWGGGGMNADDIASDGKFSYSPADGGVAASLEGLRYADQLITDGGSIDIWLYNSDNSLALAQPVTVALDRAYTLNDVAAAINSELRTATGLATPWLRASVEKNRLVFRSDDKHRYAFANDTANLLQATGINTLLTGYNAATIGINGVVTSNLEFLAAGTVNEQGKIFRGDNSNALLMANVQRSETILFRGGRVDTFDGYYNSLVAEIGMEGRTIKRDLEASQKVMSQLNELRDSVSGVSLDEEIANLMKYQHAYAAAAKLITASDELLRTLLDAV